jgi:hypothetical protein
MICLVLFDFFRNRVVALAVVVSASFMLRQ